MRRYTSLLLTSFLLLLIVVTGSAYLAGAGHDTERRPMQEFTVYTTLPAEHVSILTAAYEKQHGVRVNFVPLSSDKILSRLKEQAEGDTGPCAMVLADRETLMKAAAAGEPAAYTEEQLAE